MKLRAKILSPAQPAVPSQSEPPVKEEPVKAVIKEETAVVAAEQPAIEKAVEEAVKSEPVKKEPVTEVHPKQAVQRCRSIWHSPKPQPAPKRRNPIIGIRI